MSTSNGHLSFYVKHFMFCLTNALQQSIYDALESSKEFNHLIFLILCIQNTDCREKSVESTHHFCIQSRLNESIAIILILNRLTTVLICLIIH